jgi:hypothetical protein
MPGRTKNALGLAFSLICFSILACAPLTSSLFPSPTQTPRPVVPLADMQFNDPDTGRRFRALDAFIQTLVDGTWQRNPYHVSGNSYTSSWCRGAGVRTRCYPVENALDQQVIELYTLIYPQDEREAFGLGMQALWAPPSPGWGASFYFSEGGQNTVAGGWGVTFQDYRAAGEKPGESVSLGSGYQYIIYGSNRTTISYSEGLPVRDDLALYLKGPEAMRAHGLAQIQALADKVKTQLQAHQVNTCDLGPYLGGGLPPVCTLRPMTAAEEAAELETAQAALTGQAQALGDHYQEMYAAWMTAYPLNRGWAP